MNKKILFSASLIFSACMALTYGKGIEKISTNSLLLFKNGNEQIVPLSSENSGSSLNQIRIGDDSQVNEADNEIVIKELPYSTNFSDIDDYTTVDANMDNKTWAVNQDGILIYNYSNFNTANDWLLSPGFNFEAGKVYVFEAVLASQVTTSQNILEVKMSKASQSGTSGMTIEVLPKKFISNLTTLTTRITVEETGVYRLGFHVMSNPGSSYLIFYGYTIGEGLSLNAPGPAENCAVEPDKNGALQAYVKCSMPKVDIEGKSAGTITQIEITNVTTGRKIGSMKNPPAGTISLFDMTPVNGNNTYEITCYNSNGKGLPQKVTGYIGYDLPKQPQNIRWDFLEDEIHAMLTWEAPEDKGVHELPIDKESLQYNIYRFSGNEEEQLGMYWQRYEFSDKPYIKDRQGMVGYGVIAMTKHGMAPVGGTSNYKLCGTPYETPYFESFAGGSPNSVGWYTRRVMGDYTNWTISDSYNSINPSDSDKGMIRYVAFSEDAESLASSPLIDLSANTSPVISFKYIAQGNGFEFNVLASQDRGETWIKLENIGASQDWTRKIIDLSKFAGLNNIILAFQAKTKESGNLIAVDDIYIGDNFKKDLRIASYSIDNTPHFAGMPFEVKANVVNNGMDDADDDWTLDVYCGDRKAGSVKGQALSKGSSTSIPVSVSSLPIDEDKEFRIEINYESDENLKNNTLEALIQLEKSWLPAPQNLDAKESEEGISLDWDEPSNELITPPSFAKTIDFEDYESWSIGDIKAERDEKTWEWTVLIDEGMLGDFKIIDGDHLATYSLAMTAAYPHRLEPMAWTVFDAINPTDISASHRAHSGNKAICAWSSSKGITDDWLILPQLGENKKISFWARSIADIYGKEQIEICVSKSGNNKEDFQKFSETIEVPFAEATTSENGYTFYEFTLPEDTKYVAIHHATNNRMGVLIDDITFTPSSGEAKVYQPSSYNIYRNGENIGNVSSSVKQFNDIKPLEGNNSYNVSAVYEVGESPLSNNAEYLFSGVESLIYEQPYSISGNVIIFNLNNSRLYTLEGIYLGEFNQNDSYKLSSGIYIIKAGQKVFKIRI